MPAPRLPQDPFPGVDLDPGRCDLPLFLTGIVMYSQAVADQLNIGASDLHCLNMLAMSGPLTAGQLCTTSGLTSGAVTRLVDRLESAGLVERNRDPGDRRRVIVKLRTGHLRDAAPLYAALVRRIDGLLTSMPAEDQDAVTRFIRRCNPTLREEAAALLAEQRPGNDETAVQPVAT